MIDLKPCPFCGSKSFDYKMELSVDRYAPYSFEPWIHCPGCEGVYTFKCVCGCKFTVNAFSSNEAIEAWNCRYYEQEDKE